MSNELIEQMRRHVASYKTLSRHRQACLDMCDLIESQAKRIAELEEELRRLRQHCHKIAEGLCSWEADKRIAELEDELVICRSGIDSRKKLTDLLRFEVSELKEILEDYGIDIALKDNPK